MLLTFLIVHLIHFIIKIFFTKLAISALLPKFTSGKLAVKLSNVYY